MSLAVDTATVKPLDIGPLPTIGAPVVVVSNSRGGSSNVSRGAVSMVRLDGDSKVIDTTAQIAPDASGGALLDNHAQLVGIVLTATVEGRSNYMIIAAGHLKPLIPKTLGKVLPLATIQEYEEQHQPSAAEHPAVQANGPNGPTDAAPQDVDGSQGDPTSLLLGNWKISKAKGPQFVGSLARVRKALSLGANTEATVEGMTPLRLATETNNAEIVRMLLAAGANTEATDKRMGTTALNAAALTGHTEIVGLLIQAGANINAVDPGFGSPLCVAVVFHHIAVIKLLVDAGANTELMVKIGNETPLCYACEQGEVDTVRILLSAHASVSATNEFGDTPLYLAAYGGSNAACLDLIRAGASVDSTNNDGETPLTIAVIRGYVDVAKTLITSGASPNVVTNRGSTPLWHAVSGGNVDLVRLLIAHGADVKHRYGPSQMPITAVAHLTNHDELIPILEDAGAPSNR